MDSTKVSLQGWNQTFQVHVENPLFSDTDSAI